MTSNFLNTKNYLVYVFSAFVLRGSSLIWFVIYTFMVSIAFSNSSVRL